MPHHPVKFHEQFMKYTFYLQNRRVKTSNKIKKIMKFIGSNDPEDIYREVYNLFCLTRETKEELCRYVFETLMGLPREKVEEGLQHLGSCFDPNGDLSHHKSYIQIPLRGSPFEF